MAKSLFEQQLEKKIVILDGAMGTMLQQAGLSAADFGGEEYEGCNEYLNKTAPHVLERIHRAYLEAGADVISTNTFGSTNIVLDDYDLGDEAEELSQLAAELAKAAAVEYSTADWPRFVAGAMVDDKVSLCNRRSYL